LATEEDLNSAWALKYTSVLAEGGVTIQGESLARSPGWRA